jgi:uncharacterized protein YdaU (DUF1376 family)
VPDFRNISPDRPAPKEIVLFYYQFNIGDYIKHTSHLSPLEDIAYRRLLDTYYDTEKPIPNDIPLVSRRLRIDVETVKMVLLEFFEQTEEGYRNKRADEEIKAYHAFLNKQKANGIKGGRPKNKPTDNPPLSQAEPKITLTTNQQPLTEKQELLNNTIKTNTVTPRFDSKKYLRDLSVSEQTIHDWFQLRKSKRASVSKTVIDEFFLEAEKAHLSLDAVLRECCLRGWQGFKADWVKKKDEPFNFTAASLKLLDKYEQEDDPFFPKEKLIG